MSGCHGDVAPPPAAAAAVEALPFSSGQRLTAANHITQALNSALTFVE